MTVDVPQSFNPFNAKGANWANFRENLFSTIHLIGTQMNADFFFISENQRSSASKEGFVR